MTEERSQHPHHPRGPRYDEQSALQRLEQLRRDIQAARSRREQAVVEFDAFIAGFCEPAGPRPIATPPPVRVDPPAQPAQSGLTDPQPQSAREAESVGPLPQASLDAQPPAPDVAAPVPPLFTPAAPSDLTPAPPMFTPAAPEVVSPSAAGPTTRAPEPFTTVPAPAPPAARQQRKASSGLWRLSLAAGTVAFAITGFMLFRAGTDEPLPSADARAGGEVPVARGPEATSPRTPATTFVPGPATPAAAPSASSSSTLGSATAAQPRELRLELVALRPVWIRVTVDGRRTIEREVPADFRTTIDADRAVAVRAGDAGALMVGENGGPPAPLGRTGQVVTRIFPSRR